MTKAITAALLGMGLALAVFSSYAAEAPTPEQCLACHGGTLENLAAKAPKVEDEDGNLVQPHKYLDVNAKYPHQSKVLPVCTNCHQAHPIPVTPDFLKNRQKAHLSACYSCHHMETFDSCTSAGCHNKLPS